MCVHGTFQTFAEESSELRPCPPRGIEEGRGEGEDAVRTSSKVSATSLAAVSSSTYTQYMYVCTHNTYIYMHLVIFVNKYMYIQCTYVHRVSCEYKTHTNIHVCTSACMYVHIYTLIYYESFSSRELACTTSPALQHCLQSV